MSTLTFAEIGKQIAQEFMPVVNDEPLSDPDLDFLDNETKTVCLLAYIANTNAKILTELRRQHRHSKPLANGNGKP